MLTKAELGEDAALISLHLMGLSSHITVVLRVDSPKLHLGLPQIRKEKTEYSSHLETSSTSMVQCKKLKFTEHQGNGRRAPGKEW